MVARPLIYAGKRNAPARRSAPARCLQKYRPKVQSTKGKKAYNRAALRGSVYAALMLAVVALSIAQHGLGAGSCHVHDGVAFHCHD